MPDIMGPALQDASSRHDVQAVAGSVLLEALISVIFVYRRMNVQRQV